jgi:hypothetical protein
MAKQEEEPIVYKVQLLEELVARQEKLLTTAREIINGKNRIIELCELETDIYKLQNKRLTRVLLFCGAALAIDVVVTVIRLLL